MIDRKWFIGLSEFLSKLYFFFLSFPSSSFNCSNREIRKQCAVRLNANFFLPLFLFGYFVQSMRAQYLTSWWALLTFKNIILNGHCIQMKFMSWFHNIRLICCFLCYAFVGALTADWLAEYINFGLPCHLLQSEELRRGEEMWKILEVLIFFSIFFTNSEFS